MRLFYNSRFRNQVLGIVCASFFVACNQLEMSDPDIQEAAGVISSTSVLNITSDEECSGPYGVTLESITDNGDGTYDWVWSVANVNEGIQDLSHWNITLGECARFENVIGGGVSTDGETFEPFDPSYQVDNSLNSGACETDPSNGSEVLKFDVGTTGSSKTYYKLTVNKNFSVDLDRTAFYKSGKDTGCGEFCFPGFGCEVEEEKCYQGETAWACGPRYTQKGNWAMYVELPAYDQSHPIGEDILWVKVQAGNKGEYIGAVKFKELKESEIPEGASAGEYVKILMRIDAPMWSFVDDPENVKIQGYEEAPSGNPAPGLFETHKGMADVMTGEDWEYYAVIIPRYMFYGIHLDVQKQVECTE